MAFSQAQNTDARNSIFNETNYNLYGNDILEKLKPIPMDSSRRTGCLPNTRVDLLKFVTDWINNPTPKQNILWLHGLAGSGKSTLSTTIASMFTYSGNLGAFLFFDRDVTERRDPTVVVRTLAYQLSASVAGLGDAIRAVLEKNSNILMSSFHIQFQKLLLEPLSKLGNLISTIVVILDGLDECGTSNEREMLLDLLANDFRHLPLSIRTIVTSRADINIRDAFESQHNILAHELDITSPANASDILSYFRHRMSLIRSRKRHLRLDADWPGEVVLHKLVERAAGLFVWAFTASEFINGHDPRRRLNIILMEEAMSGAEAALDALYKTALEVIDVWDDVDFVADFRKILAVVLVARQPLSCSTIDALLLLPNERPSMHTISLLGCVLQQHPTVRVLHPSFTDFLMARERCGRDVWYFNPSEYRRFLAFRCIDHMDVLLKRNMCNMTLSVGQTNESLPEDLSYACVFWIDHLTDIEEDVAPVASRLREFLFQHLLHWFEAMSILKRSRETIGLLNRLLKWVSAHAPQEAKLCKLVGEVCCFTRSLRDTMEDHPLLVYMSALPFAPTSTILYQTFHDPDSYPSILGDFQNTWSSLQILVRHTSHVFSVAVSPDGKTLASGSMDGGVQLWDAVTGEHILETRGQRSWVRSVAFSPDGALVASGSMSCNICVWDAATGHEVMSPLRGHGDHVNSVAFSPDGTKIVSGSSDKTSRIWDLATGAEVVKLHGHLESVNAVVFSPDSTRVISGSGDGTIRVWNWGAALAIFTLRGHQGRVRAVACSPDSSQLISGSEDSTVRVWDIRRGTMVHELTSHCDWVNSVAFSPDGTRIVSGSDDTTTRIWNVSSGEEVIPPLRGHDYPVDSVAFSLDGTKVMSGSGDKTILWDVLSTHDFLPAYRGHQSAISSLAFSSNGQMLASGSSDKTLRIWDAISGAEILELRGHEGEITSVTFAPDGPRVASGSIDGTVRIWNTITGDMIIPPLGGQGYAIYSVAFSPDGTKIASVSEGDTIHVWEVMSGVQLLKLRAESVRSSSVFSPDGKWIVAGSWKGAVLVWDLTTGTQEFPTLRHDSAVNSVFFSPDASRIISLACLDCKSWDATSGDRIHLTEHSDHRFSGSMYITYDGWIVDSATDRTLGRLPAVVNHTCHAVHERSMAMGTNDGHVFILNFPPALLTGPDTHPVEGKTRKRFVRW